jgi:signal transduction histidine kinase
VTGEEQRRGLNELERVEWVIAAFTHDLNNTLLCFRAGLDLLEHQLEEIGRALDGSPAASGTGALANCKLAVGTMRIAADNTASQSRELQRIYHGTSRPTPQEYVDLRDVAEKAIRLGQGQGGAHIELVAPGPVRAAAHEETVVRVLLNLVLNATQAFPAGDASPRIELRLDTVGPWAICDVTDNGPGIAPEVLPQLFQPFVTTKLREHGTGVGLAASRGLLHQIGGDLRLLSTGPGGTTFRVSLPVALNDAGAPGG